MDAAEHLRRESIRCARALTATVAWEVRDGDAVRRGQRLGALGALENGTYQQVLAPCHGHLHLVPTNMTTADTKADVAAEDAEPKPKQEQADAHADGDAFEIAFVEYCVHPAFMGRTCLACHAIIDDEFDELDEDQRAVDVVSQGRKLRMSKEEAKRFDLAFSTRQFTAKKLSLVLDLDHTLLHAVCADDVVGEIPITEDTHFFFLPGEPHKKHVVKLRPGLAAFLEQLVPLYDMFIYTHGTRLYAEEIAKIIDPTGVIFKHRIVARTDTPDMMHKSLKLLFPSCDDSMIVVLDDRRDVWRENDGNVLLIEPYHYFSCTQEINNASGRQIFNAQANKDSTAADSSMDVHLGHAMRVLKQAHGEFYRSSEGIVVEDQVAGKGCDIKRILLQIKKSVLEGCRVVFSGVFPVGEPHCRPEAYYLWQLAVQLGATPGMAMDNALTHLIIHPSRLGTKKHLDARKMRGVFVVTPEWLLACDRTWERASERDFLADEIRAKLKRLQEAAAAKQAEVDAATCANGSSASTVSPVEEIQQTDKVIDLTEDSSDKADEPGDAPKAIPKSILVTEHSPAQKKTKAVRFSEEVDRAEAGRRENFMIMRREETLSKTGPKRPSRRPGRDVVRPTGVVASGGTFDFLSKITKLVEKKRELATTIAVSSRATVSHPEKPKTSSVSTSAVAPPKKSLKDIDDAFDRLMEAEEEEEKQEKSLKRQSTDLKDQLARRRKRVRFESPKPDPPTSSRSRTEVEMKESDEEDGLDDLEADFLSAF